MPTPRRNETFGRWLEAAMYTRQISQAQLAREIGTHDAQVSRWRRGVVVPRLEHLERLSVLFGVPRSTLERLAGRSANTRFDGKQVLGGTDPELDALVDQVRAEVHDQLHGIPRTFWMAIIEAQSKTRRAMVDALREAGVLPSGGDNSPPFAGGNSPDGFTLEGPDSSVAHDRRGGIPPVFSAPRGAWQTASA